MSKDNASLSCAGIIANPGNVQPIVNSVEAVNESEECANLRKEKKLIEEVRAYT